MLQQLLHQTSVKGARYFFARRGFTRASARSIANSILNRAEERAGRSRLVSNPDYLQIEPTTACNLTCRMCGLQTRWSELRERAGYLPRESFLRMVPFLRTARLVILQGWGEPLLHPDLPFMVEVCKSQGCMVGVLTNGLLITDEIARAVVDLKLDLLAVSVDAATEETYRIVRGADLAKVEEGLERVAAEKRRRGSRYPILQLSYALMKRNLHELPLLVDLGARYGVDELVLSNLIVYSDDLAGQPVFDIPEEVARVEREARAKAEALGMLLLYAGVDEVEKPDPHCAFRTFAVLADGTVGPCGAQRVLLQHMDEGTLRELWNGEEYRSMRLRHLGHDLPHACQHCPNFTNAPADHLTPDVSYVEGTLAMRRWDRAATRGQCGSKAAAHAPQPQLLTIGRPREVPPR